MWSLILDALRRGDLAGRRAVELPAEIAPAPTAADGEIELLGEALRSEVRHLFAGSLKLRVLGAGSCNACEAEIGALLGPFYDLQRFGIDLVASPRHADGLLVCGPVTRHLEEAVRATDEATPRPRLLIAVGDCACTGGFCADSFAVVPGAAGILGETVRIPGCPPRPADLLRALLRALGRDPALASRAAGPRPVPPAPGGE